MNYKLKSCVIELTLKCPYNCLYCGSSMREDTLKKELSISEWIRVGDELADLRCELVSFIGGELFLKEGWKEILLHFKNKGMKISIVTNGFFSKTVVDDLKDVGIEMIGISIDSISKINDTFRPKGSFEIATNAIDVFVKEGFNVSVITTINGDNHKYIPQLYQYLKKNKPYITAWQLQACSPMGNGKEINYAFNFKETIEFVNKIKKDSLFVIGLGDNIGFHTNEEKYLRGNTMSSFDGCIAGLSGCAINNVGDIMGCESMKSSVFVEGNVREKSIESIWNDPNKFSYNRKFKKELLTGGCANCPKGEICGGGCRSYNFFSNNCKMYESKFCARNVEMK